ncbi:5'-methylthioadenosine/S-adenosylhomocysteine nucleosidase [Parasphingorhabdus halotolerans]|uniref:5'-methylthioadenosine/S-adenosylhomocysteine nucleosidase n=1 Tax=Parasphingorhabdus halotolerans TaxID=2725558 RepID=A0A6H2DPN5_9SPHN|nr:5'-methylthioadenosine/S-adenosylhomocysteine nucleosidase [Parasphingorhabdus halotolerans]QJB70097.1 5'-methylthioadenosine/S-adenosylhomocysteine nucleosidase [Parasphingorhabdus halotolerans]
MIERIAIIAGVQDEAEAFLKDHGARIDISPMGQVRRMDFADREVIISCSGIGKVHAGAAAMYLHQNYQPDLFLVIGTAGQVSDVGGGCFYLHEALQADYGTLEKFGDHEGFTHYDAGTWPIGPADWSPFAALPQPNGLNLPNARIATADCFVKCPERSGYLRDELKADLVDTETAAVAQIANLLGIPWASIKAVTDGANSDSSGDFHANLEQAANRAADEAARFIELL